MILEPSWNHRPAPFLHIPFLAACCCLVVLNGFRYNIRQPQYIYKYIDICSSFTWHVAFLRRLMFDMNNRWGVCCFPPVWPPFSCPYNDIVGFVGCFHVCLSMFVRWFWNTPGGSSNFEDTYCQHQQSLSNFQRKTQGNHRNMNLGLLGPSQGPVAPTDGGMAWMCGAPVKPRPDVFFFFGCVRGAWNGGFNGKIWSKNMVL